MRKHGWQLPYHPLQVVAIAVFLALAFAFYVFFAPFVGNNQFQYVLMGLYTPMAAIVFCLYVWCAATDPGDPGVFNTKKYLNVEDKRNLIQHDGSRQVGQSARTSATRDKPPDKGVGKNSLGARHDGLDRENSFACGVYVVMVLFSWCPLSFMGSQHHPHEQSSEQQLSEGGMFYCSLCEVEVMKYSKHCRVCDKCVDGFDHHCRWVNNCIGKRNYKRFFFLMMSAILLLILQWSVGILLMILCLLERKRFSVEISSKLGSSFTLAPYIVVVALCTSLAMVATLPLAQLFFFHILLIKKGISTYDYIVAMREQEQQGTGGQQSPQMSPLSSLTGLSSTSSFSTFHRGAWCTPPRLFLEDQFVVPRETGTSVKPAGKNIMTEELAKKKKRSSAAVKTSPWTLARLDAEQVTKAAAQARKRSRILLPIPRRETPLDRDAGNRFDGGSNPTPGTSNRLAPLQREARSVFRTNQAVSSAGIASSYSPDSSLDSPERHSLRVSSSGCEEAARRFEPGDASAHRGAWLSTCSDGYEASGGEDSDRVPSRIVHRSSNWSDLISNARRNDMADRLSAATSSASMQAKTRRH